MASFIRTALLFFLAFLFLHEHCSSTRRWARKIRYRRHIIPPCPRTKCKVSLWSKWSSCTNICGNQGTQQRTRVKVIIERCKGICPYHMKETRACNRNACLNGGSPAKGFCACPVGFNGTCCETEIANVTRTAPITTTTAPSTSASTTVRLSTDKPQFASKCFKCLAPYPLKCKPTMQTCKQGSVCYVGRYTIKHSGRKVYASGCTRPNDCNVACKLAIQTGKVTECSVQCCNQDLCNYRVLPTATTAPTLNNRQLLRVVSKLLASLKNTIDAISTLLKIHFNKELAALHKREVIEMIDKVELTMQQLDESRDPEVLKAKQDVAQTRMRVMEILKQLDNYTDADSNDLE